MNPIVIILGIALNWTLKLFAGWAFYHLTHWLFTDPAEWVVITVVSVAAVTTKISFSWTDDRGRKWNIE
ncbi:hypothetical protein vBRpoPV13_10 [Ruegeria phage vB_RpoP-V13]|uniref:Uncharacterized protein n=1 Tax=Ruegeria phage vB_RpoP-V13 TaxID=2218612 RepID=A0A2Z4QGY1_9CAUD|nr:hypothetical protein HYP63_gp10 [Ruegeria phage vB_RpoP-V13]AWY09367.1 hypothetical protein vBRpoPV13_10 [Ruegeria phage vB_RpoP-V13]